MMSRPQAESEPGDDQSYMTEINVTPLTDVFLVLLIIFMIGASTALDAQKGDATASDQRPSERGLQVHTPQGSGEELLVPQDVILSVMADGSVYVNAEQIPAAQLPAKLAELQKTSTSARVVIRGDENASYSRIMQVISTARSSGLTNVALSTRVEGGGP